MRSVSQRKSNRSSFRHPLCNVLALAALLLLAAGASYAQTPYVEPALRALSQSNNPEAAAVSLGIATRPSPTLGQPRVGFFARIRDNGAIAAIQAVGGSVSTRFGRLITAEVPVNALSAIIQSPAFEIIEASRTVSISHDSSMKAIRANLVRQQVGGTWTGSAGQGVIIGVFDTGLDFFHDDFIDPFGQTRVLALWDQTATFGQGPIGFGYGNLCTRAQIQQAINTNNGSACPQGDFNGHGTHVAGSAAGDGSATGNGVAPFTYAGVAPLADLMIVKGGDGSFGETNIMDGLRWLEQQARTLNRPMVVNVSIGGQFGAHDGSRLYEMLVDSVSRPGFVVVIAAVNDGMNGNDKLPDGSDPVRNTQLIHGSGFPGASRDHQFEILPYTPLVGQCNEFVNFSFFYEAQDRLDISIVRPDGGVVTAPFGQLVEQESSSGNVRIDNVSSRTPNPNNNAFEADIRLNDCNLTGATPVRGIWTLRVSATTAASGKPYHFWMYSQFLGGGSFVRGRTGFDNRYIVGSPGNAKEAITVGAFVTRLCWPSPAKPEGPVCFQSQEQIGDIARFSSPGPTRDGRMKPEITAPGLAIASSLSRASGPAANRILTDGVHVINQGTSMAAPHVAGAIALLLQHRPQLDAAAIREIFATTADQDQFTTRVYANSPEGRPSDWWGFGKLNVCAAIGAVGAGGSATGPIVITPASDTLPLNAITRVFSCGPTAASVTFASTNPNVATVDAAGTVRATGLGSAFIVASSGAFADTALIVVTEPARLNTTQRAVAAQRTTSLRGTVLPLMSLRLHSTGYEAIRVTSLRFNIEGRDPNASVLLISDLNRNAQYDVGERILERQPILLDGAMTVDVAIDSLTIPQRDSVDLVVAVELSGATPNATAFAASLDPAGTRTVGVRSLAVNRLGTSTGTPSPAITTTLLPEGTVFSLSENPVRSDRVVFNFAERPNVAAVYTLNGRRVLDLMPRLETTGSVTWDLRNEAGDRVASGVYFVVFDVAGQIIREKIFIIGGAR